MTKIPDLWNFSTEEEDTENFFTDKNTNTICTFVHNKVSDTYSFHLTYKLFPDFKNLQKGQKLYFVEKGGKLYFQLMEPHTGVIYKVSAQPAKNTNGTLRYKINFPKKLAKSYQIQGKDQIYLIQEKDIYLCELHTKYREDYENL